MLRNKIISTNSLIDQLTIRVIKQRKTEGNDVSGRYVPKTMDIWKISLNRSTFAEIRNDTTKEMVFDIPRVDLSELLVRLKDKPSDQLRLHVNKADGQMSITPIPKST